MPSILPGAVIDANYWAPSGAANDSTVINAGAVDTWFSGTPGVVMSFSPPATGRVLIGTSVYASPGTITSAATLVSSFRLGTTLGGSEVQIESDFNRATRLQIFTTTPSPIGGAVGWHLQTNLDPAVTYWLDWRGKQLSGAGGTLSLRWRSVYLIGVQ